MKILPINFHIDMEDLTASTPEGIENSIKEEILKHVLEAVTPMLDSEDFIDMAPSEDGTKFDISINLIIGSTAEYIDATSEVTATLLALCMEHGTSRETSTMIISDATRPLIDLVS